MNYAISKGIINLDDVRNSMNENKKNEILEKHKYKIFQDKDGRWKTTLPDESKKNGRRLIAKSTLEKLEQEIILFYKDKNSKPRYDDNLNLEDVYALWIDARRLSVSSTGTLKRNIVDWKKYYENDDIISVPLKNLTKQDLTNWAHKKIDEFSLNKKQYYNMITIIKNCFLFAYDENIIHVNMWENVRINTKKLRRVTKGSNKEQIFFSEEQYKLTNYCLELFVKDNKKITALIIPLLFITGMRIGEVVALKYEDFIDNQIYIRRSEVSKYYIDDKNEYHYNGVEIVDRVKTDMGIRIIPFTPGAQKIINIVKTASEDNHFYDNGFVFCPKSKRVLSNSIEKNLYKYCERCGIDKKSAHKIRKTCISKMVNSGIDIDTARRIAGHADMSTTLNNYTFSLKNDESTYEIVKDVVDIPINI